LEFNSLNEISDNVRKDRVFDKIIGFLSWFEKSTLTLDIITIDFMLKNEPIKDHPPIIIMLRFVLSIKLLRIIIIKS